MDTKQRAVRVALGAGVALVAFFGGALGLMVLAARAGVDGQHWHHGPPGIGHYGRRGH